MKRSIKMIALLLVLALLAGGTALVQKLNETQSVSETEGSFALTAKTAEDVIGLSWTQDGVTYRFVKKDGAWQNADDAAFPASTDALQDMADDLAGLTAVRKLEDVGEMADYGLAEPAFSITAEWSDGASATYSMGAETPFGGSYYVSTGEDGVLYAVEAALDTLFGKTGTELASLEDIPAVENASRLVVGSALDASRAETSTNINPDQLWYAADGTALSGSDVEALVDDASALAWDELIATSASQEELAAWELTDDTATAITLYGGETERTVLIGAADGSNYYARLPESSMVYTIASSDVADLLGANTADLRVTDLMPLAFENVQEAQITANGLTHSFTGVPAEVESAEETTEETTEEETEAPEEPLWALIKALKADSFVQETAQGEALLTIAVTNTSGFSESLSFHEYDAESYLVTLGSGETALTDAAAVDKIIRTFKQLV